MKRLFLLSIILLFLTGCTSINDLEIEEIINQGLNSNMDIYNVNRKGYRYYLPKGLVLKATDEYNDVIGDNKYTYYLYVDIVGYHNNSNISYDINNDAYFSKKLDNGYLEINKLENNKYLIAIINNYAKIEVIVNVKDLKKTLAYAIAIISSITYNNNVIDYYLKDREIISNPEEFNIFEVVGNDNYLEFSKDDSIIGEVKDPDYVR